MKIDLQRRRAAHSTFGSGPHMCPGQELARAEVAWQLGKRYTQDEDLQWGCAVDLAEEDLTEQKVEGTTMKKNKKDRACGTADKTDTPRESMKKVVRDEHAPKVKKTRTARGTAEPKKNKKGAS